MIQLNNDTEEQMMKKPILIISLALMLPGLVRAQEAFNSLSIGLEVGTTGIGVELAMPLVTDHLVLKGGLTAPSLSIPYSTTVDASGFNGMLDDVNSQLAASGVPDRIYSDFGNIGVDASAVLNLSSAKLLLEYYPFKKSSFHLVAGAYFGMGTGNLVSLRAQSDTRFLSDLNGLRAELSASGAYPPCLCPRRARDGCGSWPRLLATLVTFLPARGRSCSARTPCSAKTRAVRACCSASAA